MNAQHLTDELIRSAIVRRVSAAPEGDLREHVLAATAATRQRRGWRVRVAGDGLIPPSGLALRLTLVFVVLATVALVAVLVGHPADRTSPARLGALAYLSEGDLYVAGPAGESPRLVWDLPPMGNGGGSGLAWLDSETVLLNTGAAFLVVSQIPEGAYVVDVTTGAHRLLVPGWYDLLSPDRRIVAVSTFDENATPQGSTRLIEIASGATVKEIPGTNGMWGNLSPDSRFALGGTSDEIFKIDIDRGERTVLVTGLCCGLSGHDPTWSPDGSRVVYIDFYEPPAKALGTPLPADCSFRCGTLWSVPAAGGEPTRITSELGYPISPAFSPDGLWIAYIDVDGAGTVMQEGVVQHNDLVIVTADGTGLRVLTPSGEIPGEGGSGQGFDWDPDSGGLSYLSFGVLWHITLDGHAERIGTPVISEFARQVVP